jgi:hypothetical protein
MTNNTNFDSVNAPRNRHSEFKKRELEWIGRVHVRSRVDGARNSIHEVISLMTLASDSDSQIPLESWRDAQQAALCAAYRRLIYIPNEGDSR